jgi:hypothetical protein
LEVFTHKYILDAPGRFSSRSCIPFFLFLFYISLIKWIESIYAINHIQVLCLYCCCEPLLAKDEGGFPFECHFCPRHVFHSGRKNAFLALMASCLSSLSQGRPTNKLDTMLMEASLISIINSLTVVTCSCSCILWKFQASSMVISSSYPMSLSRYPSQLHL